MNKNPLSKTRGFLFSHIKPPDLLVRPYEVISIHCDGKESIIPPATPYLKGRRNKVTF